METTLTIMSIIFIVFGIMQIVLFFKLWGMTNDIKEIKIKYLSENKLKSEEEIVKIPTEIRKEVVENQKHNRNDLMLINSLLSKVGQNQCLVYVLANSKFEIWEKETWEKTITKDNEDLFELINKQL